MREYQLFGYSRALEAGLLEPIIEHGTFDRHLYVFHLVEVIDGKPTRILGTDGGEPEDQSFGRDWYWVVEEINKAYKTGYKEGANAVWTKIDEDK
jgi:hypothetical protein